MRNFFFFIPTLLAAISSDVSSFGKQPLYFEPNLGQTDPQVRFLARGSGFMAWITDHELVLRQGRSGETTRIGFAPPAKRPRSTRGIDKQIGTSAYFIGNDESKWVRNIPSFAKAMIEQAYPGIDVVFYEGKGKHAIEYDFMVKPGADPSQISIDFDPVQKPSRSAPGIISLSNGRWTHDVPRVHQGLKPVAYRSGFDGRSLRFDIPDYDRGSELVIDPVIEFSTFIGGSMRDTATGIAIDSAGAAYITGGSESTDFPAVNSSGGWPSSTNINFHVTKLASAPVQGIYPRIYSIYVGATGTVWRSEKSSIAVDRSGAAYISATIYPESGGFPVRNALQPTRGGGTDGYVFKISGTYGARGYDLEYATYLGGPGLDFANAIGVDGEGAAYIGGSAGTGFPTLHSSQSMRGYADGFVTKIAAKPNGTGAYPLIYSILIGGGEGSGYSESVNGIAVDAVGSAYLVGTTNSRDFPLRNPIKSVKDNFLEDAFVARLASTPSVGTGVYDLIFSTFLGGFHVDTGMGIAIDGNENVYVTGVTSSVEFPLVRQLSADWRSDYRTGFITKFGTAGGNRLSLLFSTYLPGEVEPASIAIDGSNGIYVAGKIPQKNLESPAFPMVDPVMGLGTGGGLGFAMKIIVPAGPEPAAIAYSTPIGRSYWTGVNAIAVDSAGTAYIAADAQREDLPIVRGTPSWGNFDGFAMKLTNGVAVHQTTIESDPPGRNFTVSGAGCTPGAYRSPQQFRWTSGARCTVAFAAEDMAGDAMYKFAVWYDSSPDYAASTRTFVVEPGLNVYRAFYGVSAYRVRITLDSNQGMVNIPTVSYVPPGTWLSITASPKPGYAVETWCCFVEGQSRPTIAVSIDGPRDLSVRFAPVVRDGALSQFIPVTPCRVSDTRIDTPALTGKAIRDFGVTGTCGIPANATAYSMNLTVVPKGPLGYVTVFPAGRPQPIVSTLNALDGRVKANAAIVPAGVGGKISVYATDATEVILDINGYFAPPQTNSLMFYPIRPCRLLDTRGNLNSPALAPQISRTVPVTLSPCGISSLAKAFSLNVTAIPKGPLGFLRIQPSGTAPVSTSTLNAVTGTIVANAAIVPAGTNGGVDLFATEATDVILDINGYFAPPGLTDGSNGGSSGLNFFPITPCRAIDTREGRVIPARSSIEVSLPAGCQVSLPSAARAFSINATVLPQAGPFGYLTLYPSDVWTRPTVSTLNALDGAITSNAAILEGAPKSIQLFASDSGHVLLDINGFFAP